MQHQLLLKMWRTNYIIDDLNFDTRPGLYENTLLKLIYAVRLNGGRKFLPRKARFLVVCEPSSTPE